MDYSPENALACGFILSIGAAQIPSVVAVYPNPGSGAIRIELGKSGPMDVRLLDDTGRTVLVASSNDGIMRLDWGNLTPGPYVVELWTGEGRRVAKWVKE